MKTVFKSDASLRNYNKKQNKLDWMRACMHVSALSGCVRWCQVERIARGEVFMRQRINFHSSND